MILFLGAALAFGISCVVTHLLTRPDGPLQILDHPNERSLHSAPIPRTGGLAMWAGVLIGTAVALLALDAGPELAWIAVAVVVVGIVSFIDDKFRVPVALRLTAHLIAGGLLLIGGFGLQSLWLPGVELDLPKGIALTVSVLFVVWMTNLYNFMDGMDGLAGGMAVIGFVTFSALGWLAGEPVFAMFSGIVAAAVAGFLVFNFPPARIFMGDTGSATLGFLAASLVLWAARDGIFPPWVGLLIFSPFVVDATVTLLRRLVRRDRIWVAHRTHYYQRLVRFGWGHKKTVLAEYLLMAACSGSALFVLTRPAWVQWGAIGGWLIGYAALMLIVDQAFTDKRLGRPENENV